MKQIILATLLVGMLGSCAPVISSRSPFPLPAPERDDKKGELNLNALGIPSGHMPPPGHCRIWYPNRPAGQQPPPFKCGVSRFNIPLGTYLVQRLDNKLVQVDEYDNSRPNYVVRTGKFQLSQ